MFLENRSYRRELTSHGIISFNKKTLDVTVKNLSMTGMLAELQDDTDTHDIKKLFNSAKHSRIIDIQLPEMNLFGTAKIIRFDDGANTRVALEFKQLTYKRKIVRRRLRLIIPASNDTPQAAVHVA
jgi:hypothetical protein